MKSARKRIFAQALALVCLLLSACLWIAAVQSEILTSSAATLSVSTCFYFFRLAQSVHASFVGFWSQQTEAL